MEVHAADGDHAGCTGRMHRFQDWYAHHVVERPRILMTVGLLIPIIFSAGKPRHAAVALCRTASGLRS